jgi:hypothetical protein
MPTQRQNRLRGSGLKHATSSLLLSDAPALAAAEVLAGVWLNGRLWTYLVQKYRRD